MQSAENPCAIMVMISFCHGEQNVGLSVQRNCVSSKNTRLGPGGIYTRFPVALP